MTINTYWTVQPFVAIDKLIFRFESDLICKVISGKSESKTSTTRLNRAWTTILRCSRVKNNLFSVYYLQQTSMVNVEVIKR